MILDNNYIKLLRINHWFKNLFIFVGSIVAIIVLDVPLSVNLIVRLVVVFLIASSVSSANYLINQITDAGFDAKHPQKKLRPIPSGKVSKEVAFVLLIIIFLTSFFISLKFFPFNFSVMIFVFWLAGILYNVQPIRLKDVPYVDVLSESANNPIRFLIGWFAIIPSIPSVEVLLISWSIGAFLMTAKRYDELLNFGKDLVPYRNTFNVYTLDRLRFFLILYLVISIILFCTITLKLNSNYLTLLPFVFVYSYWLFKKIISGQARARNIESFVLTKEFLSASFILLSSLVIGWVYIK